MNRFLFAEIILPSLHVFFFLVAAIGAGLGAALIVHSDKALAFFGRMNRYVSTRKASRPLSISRDAGAVVTRNARCFAAFFVLGAAYAEYGLVAEVTSGGVAQLFDFGLPQPMLLWLIDAARLGLIAGCALAMAVGVMLAFAPAAVVRLERRASRWYSTRKLGAGSETMHLALDNWMAAYPRASGLLIGLPAFAVALYFGFLLFGPSRP